MLHVVEDVPVPAYGDDQVLIRVSHAGVNPVDALIRAGLYPVHPPLPYTPGSDLAGVVDKVGAKVTNVRVGDRVFATQCVTGAYAQFAVVRAGTVWKLDEKVSFAQGAAIGVPYFTAYRSLFFKCHARPGETVLVHGASGAVGIAATQIAHSIGMTVIGTAGTEEGMKLVKECGADHVFNHREKGYEQKIKAVCGRGVDVVLEMSADHNLNTDVMLLAKFGRVVVIGCHGPINFNPIMTMGIEGHIVGVSLPNSTPV